MNHCKATAHSMLILSSTRVRGIDTAAAIRLCSHFVPSAPRQVKQLQRNETTQPSGPRTVRLRLTTCKSTGFFRRFSVPASPVKILLHL